VTDDRPAVRLTTLAVRDFRNLARVDLPLPSEGCVLVGENGQGKTNLLEAISYLRIFRSARGARDQDLVRFGADGFHVGATVVTERCHEVGAGFERAGKRKRVRIDGVVVDRLSDAIGALPSVMFSPADVELIAGGPGARRRFLDIMLALTVPGYLTALQRYRAALIRRNATLRDVVKTGGARGGGGDARVAVWEPPLAEHGAMLWSARTAWVDRMSATFEQLCTDIGESARVRLRYGSALVPGGDVAAALARALAERRPLDIRRGLTHVGPHRDDLVVTIAMDDEHPRDLRVFGSAGQQRTAAIALRMLEADTIRERSGQAPMFLLDDPFAELDLRRATRVLALLDRAGLGQTVLAVPRESDIPVELTRLDRLRIAGGVVSRWSSG
jgi:DNA replication and repair protein RecF